MYGSSEQDLQYKKSVYQLSQEQLQVEVETQQTLERTVEAFKKHLSEQLQKEAELAAYRDQLAEEVKFQYETYLATSSADGKTDPEYERKYANTNKYLNETIPLAQLAIRQKIESYEAKIKNLEDKIQNLIEAREETQATSSGLARDVMELETQRNMDGYADTESDAIRLLEQGGEGLGVTLASPDYDLQEITVQTTPQRTQEEGNLETV
jgi:chromosome segregation ATPase